MVIADNQAPRRHPRFVRGAGKTPTEYFLRARAESGLDFAPTALTERDYPEDDEDTNALDEPFNDDGSPVK
jgi:hypothetical protein